MNEHEIPSVETVGEALEANEAWAIVDPWVAKERAAEYANWFGLAAGELIYNKLRSLGLSDDEIEAGNFTSEQLDELAPEEMARIKTVMQRLSTFNKSALMDEVHRTDTLYGKTKND